MSTAVVDIGNTRVKWARVGSQGLSETGATVHAEALASAARELAMAIGSADRVLVSNVAGPDWAARLESMNAAVELIRVEVEAFGIRCGYDDPARLGVDRWIAMIGAYQRVKGAVCVIDAGTTVTFDCVDATGLHRGGLIFAGPRLIATALERDTRDIGATGLSAERPSDLELFGRNTDSAVGNAAMLGIATGLDAAITAARAALGGSVEVVLTGGDANFVAAWLETEAETRADLVLEGLAFIAKRSA